MDFEFEEGEYEQQTAAPMTAHDLASEDALLRLEQRSKSCSAYGDLLSHTLTVAALFSER